MAGELFAISTNWFRELGEVNRMSSDIMSNKPVSVFSLTVALLWLENCLLSAQTGSGSWGR